ncbi:MAG: phosphate transport system regulatory protein PhoU [Candidatus Aminicenantes bacterium RBG_16_63_16]|nr:MAG: phosphate transport system regulatory protein PhoU [Candidatus Aminicenantes bacterium RBG_16_63_16]
MDRKIDTELNSLNEKLLHMARLAEESVALAVKSLKERKEAFAQDVFKREESLHLLEVEIDELCMRLLALRQPVASDLRFITSAMKIGSELERVGDLAVNIAEVSVDLLKQPPLKPLIDIPRMASLAQGMIKDSLDAYVNRDEKLARAVCERDDEVDSLNDQIFRELLTYMMSDRATIDRAVGLILIGRHLERIADHATNIGEDVIFIVLGKTIKHHIEEIRRQAAAEAK